MATLGEPGCFFRNPSVDVVIFSADLGSESFPGVFVYVLSRYQSHICMKGQLLSSTFCLFYNLHTRIDFHQFS